MKKVYCVCIPNVPLLGEGLMKAFSSLDRKVILVLSPRIEPPVLDEEGSTAFFFTI